jgi:hypothetical protein
MQVSGGSTLADSRQDDASPRRVRGSASAAVLRGSARESRRGPRGEAGRVGRPLVADDGAPARDESRAARGYRPTTVHKCHQVLVKTLRAAVDARKLRYNPADNVPLPRVERAPALAPVFPATAWTPMCTEPQDRRSGGDFVVMDATVRCVRASGFLRRSRPARGTSV